ncbi:Cbt1p [Saccharomyces cerevisiae]|nr:hypothetical protein FZC28_6485g374 [Saccharomyces cerevisiae]KAJ1057298.1 hypothetical protein FZC27_4475g10 [Saccharomyces cerevisiae]KAJ1545959.1 Emc3p [Saccharomyces cerevisiae]PJP09289.1 Cbt1p [Saccharomyces cerevisiae]PTN17060.1 Cbt1p [Saccharomyces cerevisiae]
MVSYGSHSSEVSKVLKTPKFVLRYGNVSGKQRFALKRKINYKLRESKYQEYLNEYNTFVLYDWENSGAGSLVDSSYNLPSLWKEFITEGISKGAINDKLPTVFMKRKLANSALGHCLGLDFLTDPSESEHEYRCMFQTVQDIPSLSQLILFNSMPNVPVRLKLHTIGININFGCKRSLISNGGDQDTEMSEAVSYIQPLLEESSRMYRNLNYWKLLKIARNNKKDEPLDQSTRIKSQVKLLLSQLATNRITSPSVTDHGGHNWLIFTRRRLIDKTTSSIQQARAPQMLLDDQLKYWVLLPISIVMVLTGVLKQYIMTLITGSSANEAQPRVKLTEWQYLQWAQLLIGNGGNLSSDAFAAKKEFLVKDLTEERHLAKAKQQGGSQAGEVPNPFNDPNMSNAMMNMAKGNMASFIPQTIIMWWVNHFFAGFILMQLPFPLTAKFKEMLQTGIICQDLDVRWVSSISWYFISVLGLNPVYNLIGLNDQDMGIQAGIGGPQGPQGPPQSQVDKAMHAMANDLTIIQHETCLDNVEQRVLKQYM